MSDHIETTKKPCTHPEFDLSATKEFPEDRDGSGRITIILRLQAKCKTCGTVFKLLNGQMATKEE